uniref:Uncharacterized protein n=1 Tax=Anguilla anguilla TaxID=7936 RepID=A0A0E9SW69_ANGAN
MSDNYKGNRKMYLPFTLRDCSGMAPTCKYWRKVESHSISNVLHSVRH